MARVLASISRDAPASPVSAAINDTFAFTGTPSFTGGGGVQRYDFRWEVNDGGGYVPIAAATGLTTANTNPLVNTNSPSANSITVTCAQAGSYTIRMVGAPTSGGSYTVVSPTQTVTVSAGPEQHSGTLSVSGGGSAGLSARRAATAVLAVSGGGDTGLTAFRAAVAALVVTGGGSAALSTSTARSASLALSGGGSVSITYSTGTEPEAHSGSFSVSGGGSVSLAADTARSTLLAASGGGSATVAATSDRGGAVAITGGGSVAISATAQEEGPDATARLTVIGGGSVAVSTETARFASLSITGGGSVNASHSASQGDAKSTSFAVSGGGGLELQTLAARLTSLGVSGGGSVSMASATARYASLAISGGGRFRYSTFPGGAHLPAHVLARIAAKQLRHHDPEPAPPVPGDSVLDMGAEINASPPSIQVEITE